MSCLRFNLLLIIFPAERPYLYKMKEIFIVEDDQDIRELIGFLLESHNYKVKTFPTAEDFQKALLTDNPDLILLDIMLPDGNGIEICRELRETESTTKIPVVLMSAHADASLLHNNCADDFIAKPFDIDDLVARVNRQL